MECQLRRSFEQVIDADTTSQCIQRPTENNLSVGQITAQAPDVSTAPIVSSLTLKSSLCRELNTKAAVSANHHSQGAQPVPIFAKHDPLNHTGSTTTIDTTQFSDTCSVSTASTGNNSTLSLSTQQTNCSEVINPELTQLQGLWVGTAPCEGSILEIWRRRIEPQFQSILRANIEDGWALEFLLVGKSPSKLKPSILISCSSKRSKKEVEKLYKHLKHLPELVKKHKLTLVIVFAPIRLLALQSSETTSALSGTPTQTLLSLGTDTYCGRTLRIENAVQTTFTTCTIGGSIFVDGVAYLLTVGHAFNDNTPSYQNEPDSNPSSAGYAGSTEQDIQDEDFEIEEGDSDTDSAPCIFDYDDTTSESSDWSSATSFSEMSMYDSSNLSHSDIGQQRFLSMASNTESSFASIELLCTSVARSESAQNLLQTGMDYDWALLSLFGHELLPNQGRDGKCISEVTALPDESRYVTIIPPAGVEDVAFGGILHPLSATLQIGGAYYQAYRITTDFLWPPGTSGAWVLLDGKVCGHILAARQDEPWVYMVSMQAILSDIKDTLSADYVGITAPSPKYESMGLTVSTSAKDESNIEVTSAIHGGLTSQSLTRDSAVSRDCTTTIVSPGSGRSRSLSEALKQDFPGGQEEFALSADSRILRGTGLERCSSPLPIPQSRDTGESRNSTRHVSSVHINSHASPALLAVEPATTTPTPTPVTTRTVVSKEPLYAMVKRSKELRGFLETWSRPMTATSAVAFLLPRAVEWLVIRHEMRLRRVREHEAMNNLGVKERLHSMSTKSIASTIKASVTSKPALSGDETVGIVGWTLLLPVTVTYFLLFGTLHFWYYGKHKELFETPKARLDRFSTTMAALRRDETCYDRWRQDLALAYISTDNTRESNLPRKESYDEVSDQIFRMFEMANSRQGGDEEAMTDRRRQVGQRSTSGTLETVATHSMLPAVTMPPMAMITDSTGPFGRRLGSIRGCETNRQLGEASE